MLYEHGIRIYHPSPRQPSPSAEPTERGTITGFSKRSRRRLLQIFSCLQWSHVKGVLFITLTYHYGHLSSQQTPAQHLNRFLTELRQRYPGCWYIWRLEPQRRGAPHFHLMVLTPQPTSGDEIDRFRAWCVGAWHRIADPDSQAHRTWGVRVDEASSYRRAFAYIAKYCAKESENGAWDYQGRRWGTSRDLPREHVASIPLTEDQHWALIAVCRRILKRRGCVSERFLRQLHGPCRWHLYIDPEELYPWLDVVAQSRVGLGTPAAAHEAAASSSTGPPAASGTGPPGARRWGRSIGPASCMLPYA